MVDAPDDIQIRDEDGMLEPSFVRAVSEAVEAKDAKVARRLTRAVGATPAETEAAAWTIFAFWNQTAHRKRGEIHTFHEVMVVAHAYGVPYVLYQYGNVPSANHHA